MKTYISCGIGDLICFDSFLTQAERNSISEIYWGCRFGKLMAPLLEENFFYPNLKKQYFIDDEVGKKHWIQQGHEPSHWTFWHFRSDIPQDYKLALELFNIKEDEVQDFTPINLYNDTNRRYNGSSFLYNACKEDINWSELETTPGKYILVHYPTSTRPRNDISKIFDDDWSLLEKTSKEKNLNILVITDTAIDLPFKNFKILHMPSLKTIVALAKYAGYYFGCDSFVSILCSRILAHNRLNIKSPRQNIKESLPTHTWNHKYFAPHKPEIIQKFYHYGPTA
ncbi:hypothetical protein EBR43_07495 [bacterium]|nr:hypothetical protein [bacterium]